MVTSTTLPRGTYLKSVGAVVRSAGCSSQDPQNQVRRTVALPSHRHVVVKCRTRQNHTPAQEPQAQQRSDPESSSSPAELPPTLESPESVAAQYSLERKTYSEVAAQEASSPSPAARIESTVVAHGAVVLSRQVPSRGDRQVQQRTAQERPGRQTYLEIASSEPLESLPKILSCQSSVPQPRSQASEARCVNRPDWCRPRVKMPKCQSTYLEAEKQEPQSHDRYRCWSRRQESLSKCRPLLKHRLYYVHEPGGCMRRPPDWCRPRVKMSTR
ncbi:hypothetical protein K466DRAFT_271171 [Polyporus arcularius HHB13444]|uniref:Uncharacterized protein n=1 Tax=Polyporus arcularius HHB13444 TaxID=1314778 RepID=A0A5C3P119_9APHY|nr:hypothetical protein K466DRAFT_271171 [Polyporus arcularius HHB13444]